MLYILNKKYRLIDCKKIQQLDKERYYELKKTIEKLSEKKNYYLTEIQNLKNLIEKEIQCTLDLKITFNNLKNMTLNISQNSEVSLKKKVK